MSRRGMAMACALTISFFFPAPGYSQSLQDCITLTSCAQAATEAALRAEAAATAARRPSELVNRLTERAIGPVYQNLSGRTRIVIVTATNNSSGFTMFGSVAKDGPLPTNGPGGVAANVYTVVSASFGGNTFTSNITLIVPPNFHYNVTRDGEHISITRWIESDL